MKPLRSFRRLGAGYQVFLNGELVGYVWKTTSGAMWGSLSCTPRAVVWAVAKCGEVKPFNSAATRARAVDLLEGVTRDSWEVASA